MKKIIFITLFSFGLVVFLSGINNSSARYSGSSDEELFVQQEKQQKKETDVKTVYTCSMHPEIIQDKAGKCPKCGMNLITKEVKKDVYTCPMHSEVVQDKAGKCPKCGMNLVKKTEEKKTESVIK